MTYVSESHVAGPPAFLRSLVLDRSSPVPLYFQVSQHLQQAIEAGEIPTGTLFDNEIELADQLGLSRPTIRRAMQHLVEKGLIVRRRGIGTRVVQPKVRRALELTSLWDDLTRSGQHPTTKVLELDTRAAGDEVGQMLRIEPDTPVLRLVRLRSALDNPIAKMINHLPERVGSLEVHDLEHFGLYELMRSRGIQLHSATQSVSARSATAAEARLLSEPRSAALLTMQRVAYDDHGVPVEYGSHLYAASRYSFEINMLAP